MDSTFMDHYEQRIPEW